MRQVRGFVQHSIVAPDGDSEGNPVAVMEAQLSGLPVVATRRGIPEVVRDGETGLLVSEGDVDGMAVAMRRLVLEPALAAVWVLRGSGGCLRSSPFSTTGRRSPTCSSGSWPLPPCARDDAEQPRHRHRLHEPTGASLETARRWRIGPTITSI